MCVCICTSENIHELSHVHTPHSSSDQRITQPRPTVPIVPLARNLIATTGSPPSPVPSMKPSLPVTAALQIPLLSPPLRSNAAHNPHACEHAQSREHPARTWPSKLPVP